MGIKSTGDRCTRDETGFIHLGAPHLRFCSTHWNAYGRRIVIRERLTVLPQEHHHRVGTCHKWVGDTRWCGQICAQGSFLCTNHIADDVRRRQRQQALREQALREAEAIEVLQTVYGAQNITWRQVVDDLTLTNLQSRRVMYTVAREMFIHPPVVEPQFRQEWQFHLYWRWAINGRNGPPPALTEPPPAVVFPPPAPRAAGLAALARDAQNVHTTVVVEQTNKGLEKLLEASKSEKHRHSPEWFAARWLLRGYGNWNSVQRIVNDIQQWYNVASCKTTNDYLYRRVLDGLYATITSTKDMELRAELFKRTFEECHESVSMCCEGHISRLCNVLVGFDDAFTPPVPFGEILQNKMSAIAALEVETEEKVRQATAFFNEFAVPEADRAAWLQAF